MKKDLFINIWLFGCLLRLKSQLYASNQLFIKQNRFLFTVRGLIKHTHDVSSHLIHHCHDPTFNKLDMLVSMLIEIGGIT